MTKRALRCAALGALTIAAQAADFSYYMLSLAWNPNHCAEPGAKKDLRRCGPDQRLGFVVSGLTPHTDQGKLPTGCAGARPVPASLVRPMLAYIPNEAAIQREWSSHGACTGLTADEYFALTRRLRDSIRIPRALEDVRQPMYLSPQSLGDLFGSENPGIPRDGIRISCAAGGLAREARFCFDKQGVARSCAGVPDCPTLKIGLAPMPPPRIR